MVGVRGRAFSYLGDVGNGEGGEVGTLGTAAAAAAGLSVGGPVDPGAVFIAEDEAELWRTSASMLVVWLFGCGCHRRGTWEEDNEREVRVGKHKNNNTTTHRRKQPVISQTKLTLMTVIPFIRSGTRRASAARCTAKEGLGFDSVVENVLPDGPSSSAPLSVDNLIVDSINCSTAVLAPSASSELPRSPFSSCENEGRAPSSGPRVWPSLEWKKARIISLQGSWASLWASSLT